jgi:GDP-L-fucose synthase
MTTKRHQNMADACVYLMNLPDAQFVPLLGQNRNEGLAPLVNIGVGHDLSIRELAETVRPLSAIRARSNSTPANPTARPEN